ncbi:hypothetical protein Dimus_023435 [Dionaea muscipula]
MPDEENDLEWKHYEPWVAFSCLKKSLILTNSMVADNIAFQVTSQITRRFVAVLVKVKGSFKLPSVRLPTEKTSAPAKKKPAAAVKKPAAKAVAKPKAATSKPK